MNEKISILIADDHPVVRQGLRTFLELEEDFDVVAEATTGEEAVTLAAQMLPNVVLMDLIMPGIDGIEATRRIREITPSTRVIVLTSFSDDDKIFPAVKVGAAGYLLKDVDPEELARSIRAAHRGEAQLHPSVAARLMKEMAEAPSVEPSAAPIGGLTERELEVLALIARGMSNRQIASELVVAEKTVKTHVSNILQKLQLADRTQAALYAVKKRLVDLDET